MTNNKTIWVYWDKGLAEAPYLIRLCISSWVTQNPDWQVVVLDNQNIGQYMNMTDVRRDNPKLTIQAFSDLLRLRLLREYGGVWIDATAYCNRPLSEWIYDFAMDGVFFLKSKELDSFGNWFIYSNGQSYLITSLCNEAEQYLLKYPGFKHYMNVRLFWRLWKIIEHQLLGRRNYLFWRSAFIRKTFGVSPYFWTQYLLGYLLNKDKKIASTYKSMKTIGVERPHDFQVHALSRDSEIPEFVIEDFFNRKIPVYKMSYKRDLDLWKNKGVFSMLEKNLDKNEN